VGETTNDVILAMNNSKKPFSDVRVRRAVTHAINKPEVVKLAMFGLGRVLGSMKELGEFTPAFHAQLAEPLAEAPVIAEKILRLFLRRGLGPGGHSRRVARRAGKYDRHGLLQSLQGFGIIFVGDLMQQRERSQQQ